MEKSQALSRQLFPSLANVVFAKVVLVLGKSPMVGNTVSCPQVLSFLLFHPVLSSSVPVFSPPGLASRLCGQRQLGSSGAHDLFHRQWRH